jgi:hypothetical protein
VCIKRKCLFWAQTEINARRFILKYRKKPVEVEAVQLLWKNWSEICDFVGVGKLIDGKPEGFNPDGDLNKIGLRIPTSEGVVRAVEGDWIIKGIEGEFYPCKDSVFQKTYEEVKDA